MDYAEKPPVKLYIPFLLSLFILLFVTPAQAQPQLSTSEYKQLQEVHKLLQAENWENAHRQLLMLQQRVKRPYSKALVMQNLAHVALQRDNPQQALSYLEKAYALDALPEQQQINLIGTLGRLHCMQENWKQGIRYLEQRMKLVPVEQITAEDQLLLGQSYAQLEDWRQVIPHIQQAIALKGIAPESWYQLQIVAHIHQKQWASAIKQQQVMINHYPDRPSHWQQLASLHLQNSDSQSALASLRIAYERGYLKTAQQYRLLAQLMLQHNIPYKAADVLQTGMDKGILLVTAANLELLGSAWIHAQENGNAANTLALLNKKAPTQQRILRLAHIQMQQKDWEAAQATLHSALQRNPEHPTQLQLLLGISSINLHHYETARLSLLQASENKALKQVADQWLHYLNQMSQPSE